MNIIQMLNTIRSNASATYQDRIPVANQTNIESIGALMIDDENVMVANEFMTSLMNRIIKTVIHNKMFSNPLKALKGGSKPLGDTVEEIYNNFLKGREYDPTGANLLSRHLPDTKAIYHRMNYKLQYPITVSEESLRKAFKSESDLQNYVTNCIETIYNSAEFDEFMNTKELIKNAVDNDAFKVIEVTDPLTSSDDAKDFIKVIKTISSKMSFPSSEFNSYLSVQSSDTVPITTFSKKNEQILILDSETDVSVSVDVLASTFNMSVADFNDTRKIVIDQFPETADGKIIRGCLVDKKFFQIYDDLYKTSSFYNGQGLYTNFYLNVWQTIAYSTLVNAVAFVCPAPTPVGN